MVKKAYGKANGENIIFTHDTGDVWKVDVPWTDDGKYLAEIWTEDEAGNVSYLCNMLFVISGHELQACIIVDEKNADMEQEKYQVELIEGGYEIEHCICSNRAV